MKKRLCVETPRKSGVGSTIRDATKYEITEADNLRGELSVVKKQIDLLKEKQKELEKSCNHRVIYDKEGFPYDIRICFGCGKGMGLI
jgi:hypothetical protein